MCFAVLINLIKYGIVNILHLNKNKLRCQKLQINAKQAGLKSCINKKEYEGRSYTDGRPWVSADNIFCIYHYDVHAHCNEPAYAI